MLENKEGQTIPDVTFRVIEDGEWKNMVTDDLFAGKTVIVFSLPGAFTPTCSGTHLPRFNELAPVFKQNGVDEIICMSVNDTFVMNAWKENQESNNVTVLPDGNGEFTEGMGMLVGKKDLGFGDRSWRYSMLVKDKKIEKMFIEPEVEGDPFEVSDADTMLDYINANAVKPEFVSLISRKGCIHCERARKALEANDMPYEEVVLGQGITSRTLRAISGATTTPQVFIGGKLIGTANDLDAYLKEKSKK
ncbi:MAG: glutaredoxin-like protein [Gammaproteobacteria bacterium]|jgi:glutaredoxin-like protein